MRGAVFAHAVKSLVDGLDGCAQIAQPKNDAGVSSRPQATGGCKEQLYEPPSHPQVVARQRDLEGADGSWPILAEPARAGFVLLSDRLAAISQLPHASLTNGVQVSGCV